MYPSISDEDPAKSSSYSYAIPSATSYACSETLNSTAKPKPDEPITTNGSPVSALSQKYTISNPGPTTMLAAPQMYYPVRWSTGIFGCFEDIDSCCVTFWCPCITFGRIAEIVDRSSSALIVGCSLYTMLLYLTCCPCLYSCFYRSKLRGQFFLEETPCSDCCVHCCCEQCALCQEYRELQNRGFDMSIGWHGNMEKQKRLAGMAPTVEEGMKR